MMIEPTETESKEDIDRFIAALRAIAAEDPGVVTSSPRRPKLSRLDETLAARKPCLAG
jgi:glycine dehydrogenase subunit 2